MDRATHLPVMVRQVLEYLQPRDGGVYFDGTVGMGGHARAILDASGPTGVVVGVDLDPEAAAEAVLRLASYGKRARIFHENYTRLEDVIDQAGATKLDGILLDLGIGSHQLDSDQRGFSIEHGGPLDMRFDPDVGRSAGEVVNRATEKELARIIGDFGEERRARTVARAIVWARAKERIRDAGQLATIVARAIGPAGRWRIHPATRTFMALRIFVNNELGSLERFIDDSVRFLAPGGTMVIISFHSLEDRIVKERFLALSGTGDDGRPPRLVRLTKKPVTPDEEEARSNVRARSAKMRAARKVNDG